MKTGKLVRDEIPSIIQSQGRTPMVQTLDDAAYRQVLRAKLCEEAGEFASSGAREELADVLEVVHALAEAHGVPLEHIQQIRREKRFRRGGFSLRIFLVSEDAKTADHEPEPGALTDRLADYRIRAATIADTPQIVELSRRWTEEGCTVGCVGLANGDHHIQSWMDAGYLFVAERDGRIVAFAAGVVKLGKNAVFKPEGERFLHVHEVYVHPAHRSNGVGNRLVDCMLSKAKSEGVTRSMVGSNNRDWLRTYRFYERHGYTMFSIEMVQ